MPDNPQLLWGINTALLGVLFFFIRLWMSGIKESIESVRKELEKKTDGDRCDLIHKDIEKHLHLHGSLGTAGEVIQK